MEYLKDIFNLFKESKGVTIDSRTAAPGMLFIAIRGDRFDGNTFAVQALEIGCIGAVVDDPSLKSHPGCYYVDDSKKALQDLATLHRRSIDCPVLCITGSNGKTTTKELVHQVLSSTYKTHATKGNFNNLIGLPLTMLAIPPDVQMVVLEIGTNSPGEIEALCKIAEPTAGIITNIGKAHLEGFGNIQGVIKEKGALYDYLRDHDGLAFVNKGEQYLEERAEGLDNVVFYGINRSAEELYFSLESDSFVPIITYQFTWDDTGYNGASNIMGPHNTQNIATALTIGLYYGVEPQLAIEAIADYIPKNNRSQIINRDGATIIMDAYNANPTSVKAALKMLELWNSEHKIAVLGDMLEGGSESVQMHSEIVQLLVKLNLDAVYLVGNEYAKVKENPFPVFPNVQTLKDQVDIRNQREGSVILVKGSRSIRLEQFLPDDYE